MKKISEDKEGLISTAYHDDHANKSIVIERKVNHQSILDNNKSRPLIKSLRFGTWQIAFAAQIKSVFFLNFFKFLAVLYEKNLLIVLTFFFIATEATFFDGSIPSISVFDDLKFFKSVPSLEPISIIFFAFLK